MPYVILVALILALGIFFDGRASRRTYAAIGFGAAVASWWFLR